MGLGIEITRPRPLSRRACVCFLAQEPGGADFRIGSWALSGSVFAGFDCGHRPDRFRLCALSRRRVNSALGSAAVDAPHRRRADVAGEHCGGCRLYSRQHQAGAEASDAGRRQALGDRTSLCERRSRRHNSLRGGAGLGGLRSDDAEISQRCRSPGDSGRRLAQRHHRHRRRYRSLSGAWLPVPSSRRALAGFRVPDRSCLSDS